ncbi:hypothetical protein PGB28_05685 [Primorskyibacter aestuariivivens]|uniref:hypothetical protein n=1 Tax=Primorskyibacter aestuariivivens TaxID=1888912 RepID=UPI002301D56D|nr:hypothetical protein [Primorskyibacter aestuariivivens]MDA7427940.1 hypothetical protein [Primorskyibacter aestuariivivens]
MADAGMTVAPRAPEVVMKLARMGSFHQTRLSFMRILLRRLKAENWRFDAPVFDIDMRGQGVAVYAAHGPERSYSLIAFANDLPPEKRSDRVIATEWDATFTLFDGGPEQADIERLRANVPLQEAGRISERELSLSRANRSVRLWDHVVDRLASGQQPDVGMVEQVGYLMRTTAVYGSGKFGAADREMVMDRPEFQAPFQVEMLSVFLTRAFVMDLVEHMARLRAPETAVPLDPALRRRFGIGNSTGLGMAPFLINHPVLLNNWMAVREEALARVRSQTATDAATVASFTAHIARAQENTRLWRSEHPAQVRKLADLRGDLDALAEHAARMDWTAPMPWDRLWRWAEEALGLEGQEALLSLMLEPHGALVDGLECCLAADEAAHRRIDGTVSVARMRERVEAIYDWALRIDWTRPETHARVWYTSEEKLEPRLEDDATGEVAAYALPLCPGRDAALLRADLQRADADETLAAFLMRHPEHRHIARRAQIAARFPYAEIRDNTIAANMLPIDLLRAKLSCFGATHFDPRSDRWVRINMFRGAPFPGDLVAGEADDWMAPALQEQSR